MSREPVSLGRRLPHYEAAIYSVSLDPLLFDMLPFLQPSQRAHKAKLKKVQSSEHPVLTKLEQIARLPQPEWLPRLQALKWRGSARINLEKWKNILERIKAPINAIDVDSADSTGGTQTPLIYAIISIYVSLITQSNSV